MKKKIMAASLWTASNYTMISSSAWVPRGFAAEFPSKYEMDDEEMEKLSAMAALQIADAQEQMQEEEVEEENKPAISDSLTIDDNLKEYDLEHYDDDVDAITGEPAAMFPGLSLEAQYLKDENDDAYLQLPSAKDEEEEKNELQVYPTDNLVLATRTEDEVLYLDVYVYDDGAGAPEGATEEEEDKLDQDVAKGLVRGSNLYVHHDMMLPAFPLCVEWVLFAPGGANDTLNVGNFAAVGTFDPQIEIWNLDLMDKAFPDVILGAPEESGSKKKKGKKKKTQSATHHTDAVLSLAHNRLQRLVLGSTSADATVKLWDLCSGTAARSMAAVHAGKPVSLLQWHNSEAAVLLTGGYDGCVALSDVRIGDDNSMTKRWSVGNGQEVELVRWGHDDSTFYAGTDAGNVYCFDARVAKKPVWTLQAHDAGILVLEPNVYVPGMLATGAMGDKLLKLWRVPTEGSDVRPLMVLLRDLGVGNVLTAGFAPDIEVSGNVVVGGAAGPVKMWDVFLNRAVRSAFGLQIKQAQKRAREEAKTAGRALRMARKYQTDVETVIGVEEGEKGSDEEWDDMEGDDEE